LPLGFGIYYFKSEIVKFFYFMYDLFVKIV
jgi:hypothetical protein